MLSCVTGVAEPLCLTAPRWKRLSMIGMAKRSYPLHDVGAAAFALLGPLIERARRKPGARCIAVQLRYGDACGHNAFHTARDCGPVDDYVRATRRLHARYGYERIVVASDSATKLSEFVGRLPRSMHAERASGGSEQGLEGDSLQRTDLLVENLMRRNKSAALGMFRSFMRDLAALAVCDAVVAKFTSNIGRLVLELISARLGRVAPFISLDVPWCFGGRKASPSGRGFFPC